MKKVLSVIAVVCLAVATSNSAYACIPSTWKPCTPPKITLPPLNHACRAYDDCPPSHPTPPTHPTPPSHHGVSEPIGILAMLTAVSVYFVARKRA